MNQQTCFVVMAIGSQNYNGVEISYDDLRDAYESVIRAAIVSARPMMTVTRADDVAIPGTITTDILTHLMYDDFVIVDVTYPNPNVYYELGIRHCCKPGTILIKNADVEMKTPFDVSHQRFIEYTCTAKGVQLLSKQLKEFFSWYDKSPGKADNQMLHLAQLIKFEFPQFGQKDKNQATDMTSLMIQIMSQKPEMLSLILDTSIPEQDKMVEFFKAFSGQPQILESLITMGLQSESNKLLGSE
jgi:hypothetical protein